MNKENMSKFDEFCARCDNNQIVLLNEYSWDVIREPNTKDELLCWTPGFFSVYQLGWYCKICGAGREPSNEEELKHELAKLVSKETMENTTIHLEKKDNSYSENIITKHFTDFFGHLIHNFLGFPKEQDK